MSPKIRVVRVFSRLNIGGPSVHVILCTAGLDPARFETTLVVGREGEREGSMFDLAERHGVRPLVIPSLGREISFANDTRATLALWRLLRKIRPHVVHTHTSKAGFSGRIAARLAGVPVVLHTFHGHVFHGYFGPARTAAFVVLERSLAHLSDAIITISSRLEHDLLQRRIAPPDKIRVIELGLDLQRFLEVESRCGALRSELGIPSGSTVVGIVGRLVPIKDHNTFLDAAARVAGVCPDVHFAVVGDGELRLSLEDRASRLGLSERVHFCGWRSDLPAVYADLDLVVVSSLNEGTPVSLIEAAAAGRPTIATRVGGVPDLIDDGRTGMLVDPGSPEQLSEAIVKTLADPTAARERSDRARMLVRGRYAAQRLLDDLERTYINLLEKKGIGL